MLKDQNQLDNTQTISSEEIDKCIAILEQLVADTNQIFDLPQEKRAALLKASGMLSRPNRDEFSRRRKDGKKAAKRKMVARDKSARKETGIRSAREAILFEAPKDRKSTRLNSSHVKISYAVFCL